ncbi:hypothetical protein ACJ73_06417 [Blastomyces percursus]|uniref:Uncharacterized protein n=1 Tax=Blastomyces percursus TaxID=1658174 RepID=A0A1J9Q2B8_9EURO|nr:hypothetical protein ACJ73_06417 [Blastomyces percursus]
MRKLGQEKRERAWKKEGAKGGLHRRQPGLDDRDVTSSRRTDAATSGRPNPERTTPDPNGRGHAGSGGRQAVRGQRGGVDANRNNTPKRGS